MLVLVLVLVVVLVLALVLAWVGVGVVGVGVGVWCLVLGAWCSRGCSSFKSCSSQKAFHEGQSYLVAQC